MPRLVDSHAHLDFEDFENDLDGVAAVDRNELGARRSAREEVVRQIRAAFAEPVERDARYEVPA